MSSKNEIMKLRGFDQDTTLCEIQREQPFSDISNGKHFGMPISTCKFLQMLFRFWLGNKPGAENPFADVWWVNFSKASLFRILAQEDVEYVRFYFAIPEAGINEASLALEGIKTDGSPVKLTQILAVANTMSGADDVDPESPGNDIMALTGGTPPPNNEEKGNGGPPIQGNIRDISSLKEFFDTLEQDFANKDLTEGTFRDFIAAYYLHAQENFS
jgi:hypothetical protein